MLFVSLFPLLLRRCVLPVIGVGLTAISCFAQQPVFFIVDSTPYDNQMARVGPILASAGSYAPGSVSLMIVNHWMIKLHALRYKYSKEWKTPDEVRISATADCKGKAIALYEEMAANGAERVRFIIGKHRASDALTHAWLEWETDNETTFSIQHSTGWQPKQSSKIRRSTFRSMHMKARKSIVRLTRLSLCRIEFRNLLGKPADLVKCAERAIRISCSITRAPPVMIRLRNWSAIRRGNFFWPTRIVHSVTNLLAKIFFRHVLVKQT